MGFWLKALIGLLRSLVSVMTVCIVLMFTMNYSRIWEKTVLFFKGFQGLLRELFVNKVLRGGELCFFAFVLFGCIASVSHWGGSMAVQSTAHVPQKIISALKKASAVTGADFDYLVNTAARESGFRPGVKAPTSSATGLFQFIDSTWLQMVKEEGPSLGLKNYADHISRSKSGRYFVKDSAMRQEILNLRKSPEVASLMAGAFTKFNATTLEGSIGRKPTSGELYIAHFLGAGSGAKLINAAALSPDKKAADLFPAAARSNKSLFYKAGEPVSVKGLYQNLVRKHHAKSVQVAVAPPPLPQLKPAGIEGLSPNRDMDIRPLPFPLRGDEIKAAALRATEDMAKADNSQGEEVIGSLYSQLNDLAEAKTAAKISSVKVPGELSNRDHTVVASADGAIGVWRGVGEASPLSQQHGKRRLINNLQNGVRPILETGTGARGLFQAGGLGFAKS